VRLSPKNDAPPGIWYSYQIMAGPRTTADPRNRILDAALALVAEEGAAALTQPRVSRAAGVRQSHLTYYFPTRADLLQAVAEHSIAALGAQVSQAQAAGSLDPGSLAALLAAGSADKRRIRIMLALVAAADADPAIRRRLRRFIVEMRAGFARQFESAGLSADPDSVAFLHALVVGSAVLQLARDDAAARGEARAALRRGTELLARSRA
jgi:AcrR family transcriptional regulator